MLTELHGMARNMTARLVIALAASLWLAFGVVAAERRVALVLGNSEYQHAPALKNPVRDAMALSDVLQSLGFEVISGYDLDKLETQNTIATFARDVRGADVALFFYAGHGIQVAGRNYLLPVDAALQDETSLDFEAVQLDFVLRQMSRETGVRMVFLDACRDNPLAETLAAAGVDTIDAGLAKIEMANGGAGTLVAFATSPGEVAYDGAGEHSPFSSALLRHIGQPNVPITEAMTLVTGDVFTGTAGRQRPWVTVSLTESVVLNKIDVEKPLILGKVDPQPSESGTSTRTAAGTAEAPATEGADEEALMALNLLRRQIPQIETNVPIVFDRPIAFGDPAIDGKSLADLIGGKPMFSPIEGLDPAAWDQQCSGCHAWSQASLCEQARTYANIDVTIMRLPHPYGPRFKVALGHWAENDCK